MPVGFAHGLDSHGLCQCASATYLLLIDMKAGRCLANCLLQHSRCRRHECARTQDFESGWRCYV